MLAVTGCKLATLRENAEDAAPGGFIVRGAAGASYRIGVFADRNANPRADPDEPVAIAPEAVTVPRGWKSAAHVDLTLPPRPDGRVPPDALAALQASRGYSPARVPESPIVRDARRIRRWSGHACALTGETHESR